MNLVFTDYRQEPATWAKQLGISLEAVQIYLASEVIDLHTDTFLWQRLANYNLAKRHQPQAWGNPYWCQVDLPRCLEAQMAGLVWDIPTNPLRWRGQKRGDLRQHISNMLSTFKQYPQHFQPVVTYADYRLARQNGQVACWLSLQGGQAVDNSLHELDYIPEIHRITLVHFTRSRIGASNFDRWHEHEGLSAFGKELVQAMVQKRILVDLSHINRRGFFDALAVMPADIPPVVTHTGVKALCNIWRNIDDEQIKAISARGGTIGVIYADMFLARERSLQTIAQIVSHMAHIINIAGDDCVSLGSDYDGMIRLPQGFTDITAQPILVEHMLQRGWSSERIQKILGANFLRVIQHVRPD